MDQNSGIIFTVYDGTYGLLTREVEIRNAVTPQKFIFSYHWPRDIVRDLSCQKRHSGLSIYRFVKIETIVQDWDAGGNPEIIPLQPVL
jgi:hypothetical protein